MKSPTTSRPRRVILDKIASASLLADLKPRVDLGSEIPARAGTVVAGRILNAKTVYNELEDYHGRMRLAMPGDIVAGVLGHRNALSGYVGEVPASVEVGDIINILNLGGVMGKCTSYNPAVGSPFDVEVLGSVMHYPEFGERVARPVVIEQSPELQDKTLPDHLPPIAVMVGSAMNSGKTTANCELLRQFKRKGLKVAAAKCTGVSLQRDVLEMRDFGASMIQSFMHLGVITTSQNDSADVTRAIIRRLAADKPDAILLEFGDGLLGTYGVAEILRDVGIHAVLSAVMLCASDPVSAWGGMMLLRDRFDIKASVITGPVTDNKGGAKVAQEEFDVAAFNARKESEAFGKYMMAALGI